jgi:acetyl-CoA C-acetyltransferase
MKLGESALALAGGTEAMSRAPFLMRNAREGLRGNQTLEDPLLGPDSVFVDPACGVIMGGTCEILSEHHGIGRVEMDEFALRSQQRARAASESGRFGREIVPVEVKAKGGTKLIEKDEHIRDTTLEKLGMLKPAFKPGGMVTPGNASGINDGAALLVLATQSQVDQRGLKPLARIVSWGIAGVKGEHMGIGPVPAIRMALSRANMTLDQMDLIEINEAFAGQFLACAKDLQLDLEKANVHGGAIALGHPIGASGARVLLTLAYELAERQGRYGVASACIGGGQGIAMVLERV